MDPRIARRPAFRVVGALVSLIALSGCGGIGRYQSNFTVTVVNKTINTISALANGSEIGQVSSGQTASFTIQLPESNSNVFTNGVAPTPQAEVTLSAKDLKTGAVSAAKTVTVSQNSPIYVTFSAADFPSAVPTIARMTVSPTNPGVNQDVFFNASSSSASNGTFVWDFGDGQRGEGVTTTHQYPRAGTFTVTLNVTSDNGASSSASRTINVSASLPPQSANFTFSPTVPAINQDVVFTASSNARDAVPGATFAWNFGDGTTGSGSPVTHRYTRASTYTVTMTVSNSGGHSATPSRTVTVSATLPAGSVNFTFSPTTPGVNDDVFFNASASTIANATFSWNYGDGTTGSGVTSTHRYSRAATYTVSLTATNDFRQSATISRTITVSTTSRDFVAAFTFSPTDPSITNGTNNVIFDAADSSTTASSWAWDFGDGETGSGQRTSHSFSKPGTWVVRLTIGDSSGRTATTTKGVTVAQ